MIPLPLLAFDEKASDACASSRVHIRPAYDKRAYQFPPAGGTLQSIVAAHVPVDVEI